MDGITYGLMGSFYRRYLRRRRGLSICDVGSCDVNGSFRPLFGKHKYLGLDIAKGGNVDVVSEDLYKYPFPNETFDVVISGSTIEHVKDMFKWILELKRIMKKGGLICIIGPSVFRMNHPHPVDCWRIYPDGMKFLLEEVAGFEVLKIRSNKSRRGTIMCMGIGKKND